MRVLVTGSTGFVGRNLIPKLISRNHQIFELTRNIDLSNKYFQNKTRKYLLSGDQEKLCESILDFNPEALIHLAAYISPNDDFNSIKKMIDSNIIFFCRILDSIKEANLKLFINTCSFSEYLKGDGKLVPGYFYAATKTATRFFLDYYSLTYGFKQFNVIPYTIYGGNDSQKKIIDLIFESLGAKTSIDMSPGEQILDFIHIDDVCDFYVYLLENSKQLPIKEEYHLGTGKGHSLRQIAAIFEELTNTKARINWGGKPYRKSDIMLAVAKNLQNISVINWKPKVEIQNGISMYLQNKLRK